MLILALSAGFVGLVHSLAPGHWLPVVLLSKGRKWPLKTALVGAVVAASGHILLSILLGAISIFAELQFLADYEEQIERYAGLGLAVFGLAFAAQAFFRHSSCHGHTHHGPPYPKKGRPFLFLFTLGLSPCVAAIPVFIAAAAKGPLATLLAFSCFALGVLLALIGATLLVSLGLLKLDHPLFEHYGDVITGGGVALMGVLLFLFSH